MKHKASSVVSGSNNNNSLIPLNPIDRKTSQIFYAQNQAKVFITVNEDDSNSQGSDVSPKKIDQVWDTNKISWESDLFFLLYFYFKWNLEAICT